MQAIQVHDSPTKLCDGGNRDFVHVYNNSDVTIYLMYDGSDNTGASLTTANGLPVLPTGSVTLDNIGPRNIFKHPVWAIHGSAGLNKEVRVQGI